MIAVAVLWGLWQRICERDPADCHRQEKLAVRWFGAGKRAAAIQSLLGTARLNGLDPAARLRDTLEKLPTWRNNLIDALLPLRQPA